jgi:pyochelin biosynthetic protein PchC
MPDHHSGGREGWLRRHPAGAAPRLRLVCFPHAGGTASAYRQWPARLPADVELIAVRYPGRQDRLGEPFVESMDEMADLVVAALGPELDLPVALFGHSMGSAIAFEVARRLPVAPLVLFASGRAAPHLVQPSTLGTGGDAALLAEMRRLDPGNAAVFDDVELRDLVLPAVRADYRLIESYRPAPDARLAVPIVAYIGDADPTYQLPDVRAWSALTTASCQVRVFSGGHFFLVPREAQLLADLVRRLDALLTV